MIEDIKNNQERILRVKKEFQRLEQDQPIQDGDNIFGLNINKDDALLILLPVPWEATASYHKGTLMAYKSILEASYYVDLQSSYFPDTYKAGIHMELSSKIFETPSNIDPSVINPISEKINDYVYSYSKSVLDSSKFVGIIGGEHSVPYGLIKVLNEKYPEGFSVLHIDAHHDLRSSYEGYRYSHASIMYNVLNDFPNLNIVSYGIRDYSKFEFNLASSSSRITTFYDRYDSYYKDELNSNIEKILSTLKNKVYISFDIDGLSPELCPHTGTPVPGGIPFNVAKHLLSTIGHNKTVIGFDLCEVGVSSNLFAENVASRILYELCGCLSFSNNLIL